MPPDAQHLIPPVAPRPAIRRGGFELGFIGNPSVQMNEALQMGLQEARGHAGDSDALTVPELDDRIAMRVASDRGHQFLCILHIGEMIELDGVRRRVEVADRLRTSARLEHERVVAGSADGDGGTGGGHQYRGISD